MSTSDETPPPDAAPTDYTGATVNLDPESPDPTDETPPPDAAPTDYTGATVNLDPESPDPTSASDPHPPFDPFEPYPPPPSQALPPSAPPPAKNTTCLILGVVGGILAVALLCTTIGIVGGLMVLGQQVDSAFEGIERELGSTDPAVPNSPTPDAEDEDAPTFPVPSALAEPDVPEIAEDEDAPTFP
ncbi:MAG: hypothetical protein HC911_13245, partial [Chloroflexaceae bacterium]|nr:hypothetical protein [Chloroflexaceae bacterium]